MSWLTPWCRNKIIQKWNGPPERCQIRFSSVQQNCSQTTLREIQEFSPEKIVFNHQHQQGERYNNCSVEVPSSLLDTINDTLRMNQEVIKSCLDLIERLSKK